MQGSCNNTKYKKGQKDTTRTNASNKASTEADVFISTSLSTHRFLPSHPRNKPTPRHLALPVHRITHDTITPSVHPYALTSVRQGDSTPTTQRANANDAIAADCQQLFQPPFCFFFCFFFVEVGLVQQHYTVYTDHVRLYSNLEHSASPSRPKGSRRRQQYNAR